MESAKERVGQNHFHERTEGSNMNAANGWRRFFPSQRRRAINQTIGFFAEVLCEQWPLNLKESLDLLEKSIILNVLSKVGGNQKEAALALRLKYTTLNEKIKKYNIRFRKTPVEPNKRVI